MNETIVIVIESENGLSAVPLTAKKGDVKVTCVRIPEDGQGGRNQGCIFPGKEEEKIEE